MRTVIRDLLLPEYDEEMTITRKFLACVPDEKLSFRPHEKSFDLCRLASHVSEMMQMIPDLMQVDMLDAGSYPRGYRASSQQEMLDKFDAFSQAGRYALAAATDDDLLKTVTVTFGGRTIASEPRIAILRKWVLSHTIHHRAQLGVYLRLNHVAIPGTYGPSADTK